jgi:hypothetical protein
MGAWTKRRAGGSTARRLCEGCYRLGVTVACDAMVSTAPYAVCNRLLCPACATHVPGGMDYCRAHAIERGVIPREPGEEG